jgi:hypothetical protein
MIWVAVALQAAAASPAAAPPPADPRDGPQRWSILTPPPCAPQTDKPQGDRGDRGDRGDIVVCADGSSSQALPLPDEAGPAPGRGANRDLSAARALSLDAPPCGATQRGCTVGFGPPIAPIVGALARAAKSAFARKPDTRGRIPIDLSEPTAAKP